MDGNNFGNNNYNNSGNNENVQNNGQYSGDPMQNNGNYMQNNGYSQNNTQPVNQYTNYQDNTANNMYYQAPPYNGAENKASGKQIAGLVFGIIAICTSCCYGVPGIIFGVVGLVLSILGNKESKHGIGIGGLVCSIIGLIAGLAIAIYCVAVFAAVFEMIESGEFNLDEYMKMLEELERYGY